MITDLKENNYITYVNSFIGNPTNFADILSMESLKEYGVDNNEFWKNYIINLSDIKDKSFLDDKGLHKHLAKMYFIKLDNKKIYLIEKLPPCREKDMNIINALAEQLKKEGIEVDVSSAVLVDKKTNRYKFLKYKITKEK